MGPKAEGNPVDTPKRERKFPSLAKVRKKTLPTNFPDNNLLSAYTYLFCVFDKAEKAGALIRATGLAFLNGTKKLGKTFAHSENCRYLCSRFAANRCKSYPNKPN